MVDREKASQARRQLLEAARAVLSRCEGLASERGPLLKAAFQLRGTRCGKDNCKCTKGDLHATAVLVVTEKGKRRSYYIRGPERPDISRRVEGYQRLRGARIELSGLMAGLLSSVDDLLDALAEPHAPHRDRDGTGGGARRGQARRGPKKAKT